MGRTVAHHLLEVRAFRDAVSEVWHARAADGPSRPALLRVFDDSLPADAMEACLADALASRGVLHRNISRVHDVGSADEPHVVHAFARISPLAHRLDEQWPVADAIDLLIPLASALDAAAAVGLSHGALHPRTMWIEEGRDDGNTRRVVLSGFGLHHLLAALAADGGSRVAFDDFLYVAPELLRGEGPTNRSDQYALAAAIHHALMGRPMFERPTLATLFGAHLFARPSAVDVEPVDAAGEFDRILARALAKNPDDRFENCGDFAAAILAWQRLATGSADATTAADATPTPLPVFQQPPAMRSLFSRRKRAVQIAAAAAGVAAATLIGVTLARQPAPADDATLAAASTPSAAAAVRSADPAVRWTNAVDGRPRHLYVTPAGLVVETRTSATLVDRETGAILADLPSDGSGGVVAANGLFVTRSGDSLQSVDVADGSVRWQAPFASASPPTAADDTVYGVSDAMVPQLIATDAESGERLWAFPADERAFPADVSVAAGDDIVYLADDDAVYSILPVGASTDADTPLIAASVPASEPLCLWRQEVDTDIWSSSMVAVKDGVAIANRDGSLCVRRHHDGMPLWCVPVSGADEVAPTIYDAGDQVVVATRAAITGLNARTGAQEWRRAGPWRRTVRDGERLLAIDGSGAVATVSLDSGAVQRPVDAEVGTGAVLAIDGNMLYAARRDGTVVNVDLTATAP